MKSCITVSLVEEAHGGPFVLWDDLPSACRLAQQLGYDAIEVFPPAAAAIDRAKLRQLLDEHHLKLAAVGTGAGWVKQRLHLALPSESQRREARQFIREVVDFAGQFEAPAIIGSMQGRSSEEVDPSTALGYLTDALEELGEYAAQYNVPLIYEPLNRYESNLVNRVEDAVKLLERLSTRNVKLLCDLFHMNIEEADVAAALRRAGTYLGHVHFVDSNRRPVGLGHTDMRPIIAALREIGYTGYLSAEAFPYPDSKAAAEQTITAFRYWLGATQP